MAAPARTPTRTDLRTLDAWWRAANYLSVGQIFLMGNPLLREPLAPEHVKPRLLGHWGTTPGLTFLWAHLNRVIVRDGLDVLFVAGPGHGGPAVVSTAWLEGTYSERYAHVPGDAEGMAELFRQFSFPGGIPSHAAPETPGSLHEGGELGYSLAHAYGAAFDNPDLLVACVIGDGEAETGALAGSWQANTFAHPVHDDRALRPRHRHLAVGEQRRRRRARRRAGLRGRRTDDRSPRRGVAAARTPPELRVRLVNVVDLMRLQEEREHPHRLADREFDGLFTTDKPVIFAYHGYPWLIHRLTYRRANHRNIHVRGYKEEGTTTTPFDMVMRGDLDRFHLVVDVLDRVPGMAVRRPALRQFMLDERLRCRRHTRIHGEDAPDVADWTWPT